MISLVLMGYGPSLTHQLIMSLSLLGAILALAVYEYKWGGQDEHTGGEGAGRGVNQVVPIDVGGGGTATADGDADADVAAEVDTRQELPKVYDNADAALASARRGVQQRQEQGGWYERRAPQRQKTTVHVNTFGETETHHRDGTVDIITPSGRHYQEE